MGSALFWCDNYMQNDLSSQNIHNTDFNDYIDIEIDIKTNIDHHESN